VIVVADHALYYNIQFARPTAIKKDYRKLTLRLSGIPLSFICDMILEVNKLE
jgi:hypothetical protein